MAKVIQQVLENNYALYHGDCIEIIQGIPKDSVHYSIFSPPFASLYTYSDSERDMGNCRNDNTFIKHFDFLIKELYRVIMPGRLVSFHCMNLPRTKQHFGYIGIWDFRGELIKLFEKHNWIYHSEVVIWKNPVTAMQRTKALGLLHKQLKKDSCMSRQGIPDYLVTMRKPGGNPEPVTKTNESFPVSRWQNWASPIFEIEDDKNDFGVESAKKALKWWFHDYWMNINPSDTIQFRSAREHSDEKHICPLQLEVIRRAITLWTNENDLVISPFMGIGSEGFVSIELGRKFIGIELKKTYFEQSVKNIKKARKPAFF